MNNDNNSFENVEIESKASVNESHAELTGERYGRASKGLAIASLVISIITVIVAIFATYLCIESIKMSANPDNDLGTGIGGALSAVFMIVFAFPCIGVSVVSLGLGIGALVNHPNKMSKKIGISGVILSAISILACVAILIARTAIS